MSVQVIQNDAANTVLNLLNRASGSILGGMDALLLKYLWRRSGQQDSELAGALQGLIESGLIEVVPGPDMALRLSSRAYGALQEAWLQQRQAGSDPQEDEADWDNMQDAAGSAGGAGPARSELQLRCQVMAVLAELGVPADGRVAAASMAHIWAELRHRGEELRHAVDLLQRDGHLRVHREGSVAYFVMTRSGAAYAGGRRPPEALYRLAPPARNQERRVKTLADEDWLDLLLGELSREGLLRQPQLRFAQIESCLAPLKLYSFAAAHACELAHRFGYLDWIGNSSDAMHCTESGLKRAQDAETPAVRGRVHDALLAADHQL